MLEVKDFQDFPKTVWSNDIPDNIPNNLRILFRAMQITLTNFASNRNQQRPTSSHERTAFVDVAIPPLKYLAQSTNLYDMYW